MERKKVVVPILAALLTVAVGVIIFLLVIGGPKQNTSSASSTSSQQAQTASVSVPNVVRLDQHDAEKLIWNSGLTVASVNHAASDDVPAGHVISQDPGALATVAPKTPIKLVVSDGKAAPNKVTMPDLMGMTSEDAEKAIADAKLVAVPANPVYSDDVAPGLVCAQSVAAGAQVDEGSQVTFSTSLGRENVTVPNVTGMPVDDARATLSDVGLSSDTVTSYSDTVPANNVISQSVPQDTQVVTGTKVTLEVSLGAQPKEQVIVPDLTTYSLDEAKRALDSAGLTYRYTGDVDGTVVSQDPPAGTQVDLGTTVSFTLQEPRTLVAVPDVAGKNGPDARAAVEAAGLQLDYDVRQPDRVLTGTNPAAGTMLDVGTMIEASYAEPTS